ncbi:radial spoke head protein 6 homolog A-like isoform X3 [Takifugu flavidus]|uniref:Radial spoke head protein 4-like protein A n=3 Tax=Takifugu flavidus TaxID=433684 RepID=A0A5C6MR57_9TELE|nr:radial spoke head protein 6 homolog A-like isoform X3 [Takifugu flavidus]TWW57403.1 Radial spoke head protein 4 -like protein A [Takifugu flavidus]
MAETTNDNKTPTNGKCDQKMEHPERQTEKSQKTPHDASSLKAFLMKCETTGDLNLYDHLTQLLIKVTDERPNNVMDIIEDMSHEIKQSFCLDNERALPKLPETTVADELAEKHRLLFCQTEQEEELVDTPLPNLNEISFYMEQAGVGLGRIEMQRIILALKQLAQSEQLPRCRLWGKILGRENNYIIAEATYREGEEEEEEEEEQRSDEITEEEETNAELEDNEDEMPPLPSVAYNPQPAVPKEDIGTGANKFVYYVCIEPGLPWKKLPTVSPAQINAARQIRKYFTGRLESPIISYPPFPGNEANYLRAQIARISAGTHVSPKGFYQSNEEEDEEEADLPQGSNEVNPDFEGIPGSEMATSLSSWVHHVQHILPQGRCTWLNMVVKKSAHLDEEGENEELEEESEEPEPEVGPPLLTPVSQDAEIFDTPPWTLRLSSSLIPDHAVAVLHSNIWPGAHAYACGKKFENMYIGWGLKYSGEGYSPPLPLPPQDEYPSGLDITEALDPTVEEEVEYRAALEEQEDSQEDIENSDEDDDEDE